MKLDPGTWAHEWKLEIEGWGLEAGKLPSSSRPYSNLKTVPYTHFNRM